MHLRLPIVWSAPHHRRSVVPLLFACMFVFSAGLCAGPSAPGHPPSHPPAQGQALSAAARQVLAWLPGDRATTGWKRTKPPQVFGADNLWEFIDGAADMYIGYGLEELVSVTCTDAQLGAEATIDVYRLADALNAFGVYAQERNPRATFLAVGGEGYEAPNVLNFWNSRYYVKLRVTPANGKVAASLRALAQRISERIGPPANLARLIPSFPPGGQVPHSLKYLPANVLGQAYLANGFEAQYAAGATRWRLTTAAFRSAQQTVDALGRYKTFVASNGRIARDVTGPGQGGFVGSDPYNGLLVAIRAGDRLVIALGAPSERAAIDAIQALVGRSKPRQEER